VSAPSIILKRGRHVDCTGKLVPSYVQCTVEALQEEKKRLYIPGS